MKSLNDVIVQRLDLQLGLRFYNVDLLDNSYSVYLHPFHIRTMCPALFMVIVLFPWHPTVQLLIRETN